MTSLANLEELARRIGEAEVHGDHALASRLWLLLDEEVTALPVDAKDAAIKQLLIARSDSSVRLAVGVRGLFSRLVAS